MSIKSPLTNLKWCSTGVPEAPHDCAICLCEIEEQSFTNNCIHCFCRTCLVEWIKVKPECPVCRQPFEKVIFNVRSREEYEELIIRQRQRNPFIFFSRSLQLPVLYVGPGFLTWELIQEYSRISERFELIRDTILHEFPDRNNDLDLALEVLERLNRNLEIRD